MANNIIRRVWNQNRMVNIEDLTGAAFQAESGGHTFEISGIDDTGAAVELSGTVSGVFRRPDNADIALTGSASDGVVSVTLSEDCYAVPGRFGLTIFVTSNSQKVAVYACVGTVAVSSTGNVAGDTPASVEDLIDDINAAIADLNSAIGQIPASYANVMAAIAPTYSGSALYPVGAYAWYNGSLYRCITAITTAEAWTAAHWTAAVLGDDVSNLKSAIGDIVSNFEYGYFTKDSSVFTSKSGYSASSAGWTQNEQYNSWYFLATTETIVYVDPTLVSGMTYYSIAIYNGNVDSSNYVARYRKSDNNLPTENAPLTVASGQTIVTTIEYRDSDFVLYASNAPLFLGNNFMQQVNEKVTDGIGDFAKDNFNYGFLTKNSEIFTTKEGYYASSAGWTQNEQYNSWYFTADDDCNVYTVSNNLSYYSICIFNGAVSAANYIARYRKIESNLPTKASPLAIKDGQTIVVTIDSMDSDFALYHDKSPILLGNQMVTEVNSLIYTALNKTIIDASTNKYLIMSNGIVFDFRHSTNAEINQDCWNFVSVSKNGENLVNGDIIGVFREQGQNDFMGGAHGYEEVIDFMIKVDGVDITEARTVCDVVTIYMHSHLYRVSSPTTKVLDRYVHMTIKDGVLTVENTVKCLVDGFVVDYAYNGGLIGIFKQNVSFLSSNTDVADLSDMPTANDWNESSDNYWYDVELSNGTIHVENIKGNEQPNYSARVHYFSTENPQRLKIYITTDHGSTWNTGHICNGKFSYTFS